MNDKDFFIHDTALVATDEIGSGSRIWAFANVQQKVRIGRDCNICDHCFVENGVTIGNRVTIKNGVSLFDGLEIHDDVFIGPNAVFTNDIYPRSKAYMDQPVRTVIGKGASIGANATLVAGHNIGEYAMIGAGAVVTHDVPPFTLWYGNPARQAGYVCRCARRLPVADSSHDAEAMCRCGHQYRLRAGNVVTIDGEDVDR